MKKLVLFVLAGFMAACPVACVEDSTSDEVTCTDTATDVCEVSDAETETAVEEVTVEDTDTETAVE